MRYFHYNEFIVNSFTKVGKNVWFIKMNFLFINRSLLRWDDVIQIARRSLDISPNPPIIQSSNPSSPDREN